MLIAAGVAATLLVSVGSAVILHAVRAARSGLDARRATDDAAVTDCLANVDHLAALGLIGRRDRPPAASSDRAWRADDALRL